MHMTRHMNTMDRPWDTVKTFSSLQEIRILIFCLCNLLQKLLHIFWGVFCLSQVATALVLSILSAIAIWWLVGASAWMINRVKQLSELADITEWETMALEFEVCSRMAWSYMSCISYYHSMSICCQQLFCTKPWGGIYGFIQMLLLFRKRHTMKG